MERERGGERVHARTYTHSTYTQKHTHTHTHTHTHIQVQVEGQFGCESKDAGMRLP